MTPPTDGYGLDTDSTAIQFAEKALGIEHPSA